MHARYNLTYADVLELPLSLRDAMLEQINEWRIQENKAIEKANQPR